MDRVRAGGFQVGNSPKRLVCRSCQKGSFTFEAFCRVSPLLRQSCPLCPLGTLDLFGLHTEVISLAEFMNFKLLQRPF